MVLLLSLLSREREREREHREKGHIKVSGTSPSLSSLTSHHQLSMQYQTHLLLECLPSYPNIHHTPRPPSSSPSSSPRPWRSWCSRQMKCRWGEKRNNELECDGEWIAMVGCDARWRGWEMRGRVWCGGAEWHQRSFGGRSIGRCWLFEKVGMDFPTSFLGRNW